MFGNIKNIKNIKNIEKHGDKNLEGKRAGLVAYSDDGYLLLVYQNVHRWSFPKGHFDEKLDETLLDTAIREFREETNYKGYIDPSRITNKMKVPDVTLFLLELTPEEIGNIELIDGVNVKNDEILQSSWININYLDYFRNTYVVNKTISNFNISQFLLLSGLNPLSFSFRGKNKKSIRKTVRKSVNKKNVRKNVRKSVNKKNVRKSAMKTRKSISVRKSRKPPRI